MKGFGKLLLPGLAFVLMQVFVFNSACAQANKQNPTAKAPSTAKKPADLNPPKVTQIDLAGLQNLLKREGENPKPLLINFWATWCTPCIEEFPDLVKLDNDFRGKVEIITISLDDLADINTNVPKFLAKMKAEMPAYLLKTADEEAAMNSVSKEWSGALPFTILFSDKGETAYSKQGKFKPDVLRAELEKVIASDN
jgi:thiol-disulfide isomerase/thioredoxin